MTYGQATIGTSVLIIAPANTSRAILWITPTADVYIGDASVTATTGWLAKANQSYPLPTTAALYGICSTGNTSSVTFLDLSQAGFPVPHVT